MRRGLLEVVAAAVVLVVAGSALMGCKQETPVEKAQRRYELIKRYGTPEEVCDAAKAVADAYLEANDEFNYLISQTRMHTKCLAVRL